ncbi:uncharacterized protein FIBRA_00382 [Fibroporia radiculosa]|uniref:Uncharacterized protein n=1 Tax=Fibroporia radiculosa TaxID=599839 RepID=J4HRI8_9APHY|nr:uncharacterized protein FIBRA_00382 [Fibroporia radiculosa]CCL98387.1 predicted protein [Fibroporia radiculosa]
MNALHVSFAVLVRAESAQRKILRSPPPPGSKTPRLPTLIRLATRPRFQRSGSSNKQQREKLRKPIASLADIKVVHGSGCRIPCEWSAAAIPGIQPYAYTLLPLGVAQRRMDISHRAFLPPGLLA